MLPVRPARARAPAPREASWRAAADARSTSYVVLDAVPAPRVARQGSPRTRRLSAGRPARAGGGGRSGPIALALACLLASTALAARAPIVRAWPEAAILFAGIGLPVNLVGATLSDVTATIAPEDGALVVTGRIGSASARAVALPPLEATLNDSAGAVVRRWTVAPPRPALAPGEEAAFATRLAGAPAEGRRVRVTFAHRNGPEEARATIAPRRFVRFD